LKKKNGIFQKAISILLAFLLVGNGFTQFVPSAHADHPVSSMNLSINGDSVKHAFGERSYETNYYKKMALHVAVNLSDGTTNNVTNQSNYTSSDDSILVTSDGVVTATGDTTSTIRISYQNQQAAIKVQANWDYVSGTYVLSLVTQPTYGEVMPSNVVFTDSRLEDEVREQLNKLSGTITEDDMKQLTSLEVNYRNIRDLTGLEFAVNLEDLSVEGNQIHDLTPLKGLTKLKSLSIGDNQVSDLEPISELTALTELSAWENTLTNLSGLENLVNVSILNFRNNKITSIEQLDGLTSLSDLNLNNNLIEDLTPLSHSTSLAYLQLSRNQIEDIHVLENLSQLQWVDVNQNTLNADAVNTIQLLEANGIQVDYMDYDSTPVQFADPKVERAISQSLEIGLPIKKGDLQNLISLDLSEQGITSLQGLENATHLQSLYASSNFVTNLDPLLNLTELSWVDVSRNPISSEVLETIQALENQFVYVSYDVDYDATPVELDANLEGAISDIYDLPKPITKGDLSKLDYLFLLNNNIESLKGLKNATNLTGLYVRGNKLINIAELSSFAQLQFVDITRNPIDTSEGSEAAAIIKGLEVNGVSVSYDTIMDSTSIDFGDPNLEYNLSLMLDIPVPMSKEDLKNIQSLQLSNRTITRLDGLEQAASLKTLYLNNNQITELSPLASLNQLTHIYLKNNDITDLTPLVGLPNLRYLDIRNNLFDASLNSSARKIISSLQARGVTVDFNEKPDTFIKGKIVNENGPLSLYSYITGSENGAGFQTSWEPNGNFSLKLGEGFYQVTGVTIQTDIPKTFSINQPFEIRNGKLYVNGKQENHLEVKLLPHNVSGHVVDENGLPLANTMLLYNGGNVTTDDQGNFSLYLNDGSYTFSTILYNFENIVLNVPFEIKAGKLFVNGEQTDRLEIILPPTTLKGILLDENGSPVGNAGVSIKVNNDKNSTMFTDSEGKLKIRMDDGMYAITSVSVNQSSIPYNLPFEIREGKLYINNEFKEQLEIKLSPVTLKGSLLDENGLALANAQVSVYSNQGWYNTRTDSNGMFSLRLTDGNYYWIYIYHNNLSLDFSVPFEMRNGNLYVRGEIKEQLELKIKPVTLKGTIQYSDNSPVTSGFLYLYDYKNRIWTNSEVKSDGTFSGRFDDGDYYIYGLNDLLLNQYFTIKNGKMVVNGLEVNDLNIKLSNIQSIPVELKENGQSIPNATFYVGFKNGLVFSNVTTNSIGFVSLSLQEGLYQIDSVIKNQQHIFLKKPILFEVKNGKLLVNGIEKQSLVVDINPPILAVPSGVTIEAKEQKSLHLSWNLQERATYYKVFRSLQSEGPYEEIATVHTNEFIDRNLESSKTYWYKIIAGNDDGESEKSSAVSGVTKAEVKKVGKLVKGDQPLGNITFSLYSLGETKTWYDFTTDADGFFNYENLPDGEYKIEGIWLAPTWHILNQTFTLKDGLANGNLLEFDAMDGQVLPQPEEKNVVGSLWKGTQPLANITFSIHSLEGSNWYNATTDSSGKFAFTLPDGEFQIDGIWIGATNEWHILNQTFTVKDGRLVGSPELLIKISPLNYNVTGTIYNGTEVFSHLIFSFRSTTGEENWYNTQTDENGRFGFNVADGSYMIEGIWDASIGKWYELNQPFVVKNGKLVDASELVIDVKNVMNDYNVTGTLTKGTQVLGNLIFSFRTSDGEVQWYNVQTDENGNFGIKLPDGSYTIEGVWNGAEGKWYVLNQQFTVAGTLQLNVDVTQTPHEELPNVTGVVTKDNAALSNIIFSIEDLGTGNWYDTATDATGNFSFKLPNGTYKLHGIWVGSEMKWYELNNQFAVKDGKLVGMDQLLVNLP
jgi:Leucine-rich repeat (LRR) protein